MSVRIIFRGLILFRFPSGDDKDAGKLVAQLINKREIPRRPKKATSDRPPRGPHEHHHVGQIQIATDHGEGDQRSPVDLDPGERIEIIAVDENSKPLGASPVQRSPSFDVHVPRLGEIIAAGTPNVRAMPDKRTKRNDDLVSNVITVDRGTIRARQLVMWDEGAFPIQGKQGASPSVPGLVKFVGSDFKGYVASEFVVDIDAPGVAIKGFKRNQMNRSYHGRGNLNHRVPYNMAEVLITNFEVQDDTPHPFGLDFQWLFEAAGYPAVDLSGDNLIEFSSFGARFNPQLYENERRVMLDPADQSGAIDSHRIGHPFPYLAPDAPNLVGRARLSSTDEDFRPICIGGTDFP
ncbi:MAG TPA: hypothetical protein VM076_11505 [Gemmatimonadaceae bacterium]|nr:hypothetical protein [Gemmatimonadaceae bacterium]